MVAEDTRTEKWRGIRGWLQDEYGVGVILARIYSRAGGGCGAAAGPGAEDDGVAASVEGEGRLGGRSSSRIVCGVHLTKCGCN